MISIAREKKRILEATAGHKTVFWLDMMASDTKKYAKQKKYVIVIVWVRVQYEMYFSSSEIFP